MKTYKLRIKGPVGDIETVLEKPAGELRGLALIAHPHPLKGGSLDNKVAWTLARAALACGYVAVRANFRGVGTSDGSFDHGQGESDDLLAVAAAVSASYPNLDWTLLGFSFGAYVQSRVAQRLAARQLIMVAPAVSMYAMEKPAIPATLIWGEDDEVIAPAALRAYAEQHAIPSQTVADCGHFFHGKLKHLQSLVEDKLCLR